MGSSIFPGCSSFQGVSKCRTGLSKFGRGYPNLDGVIQIWMGLSKFGWVYPIMDGVIHIWLRLSIFSWGYPNLDRVIQIPEVILISKGLSKIWLDYPVLTEISKFQLGYPNSNWVIQIPIWLSKLTGGVSIFMKVQQFFLIANWW